MTTAIGTVQTSYYMLYQKTGNDSTFLMVNLPDSAATALFVFSTPEKAYQFKSESGNHQFRITQVSNEDIHKLFPGLLREGAKHVCFDPTDQHHPDVALPDFLVEHQIFHFLKRTVGEGDVVFAAIKSDAEGHSLAKADGPMTLCVFSSLAKAEAFKLLDEGSSEWAVLSMACRDSAAFLNQHVLRGDQTTHATLDPAQVHFLAVPIPAFIDQISDSSRIVNPGM